jgi:drug/metabolite transporter (DMT)-like permease
MSPDARQSGLGSTASDAGLPARAMALGLFINLLWGGNLVAVKLGFTAIPPLWSAFFRFALGVGCLALWALFRRIRLWPFATEWRPLLELSGIFSLQVAIMNWGINLIPAGPGAVLQSTNPIFAALLAHFFIPGDQLTVRRMSGQMLAIAGVALTLLHQNPTAGSPAPLLGGVLLLGSGALLGGRQVFSKTILQRIETTKVVFWQMVFSLPLFALSGALFESLDLSRLTWPAAAAMAYQGIVIAGLGFMISASLIRLYRPSLVTSFNFTTPLFAVLLSVVVLGEPLTAWLIAGLVTVALGVAVITTGE